jgi:hypothetical protein
MTSSEWYHPNGIIRKASSEWHHPNGCGWDPTKERTAKILKLLFNLTGNLYENFAVGFVGAFFCSFFGQAKKEKNKNFTFG